MTVSAQQTYTNAVANGATTVFPFSFKILSAADLVVKVDGVTKVLTADYTVSGVGVDNGGSITFLVAPVNGAKVNQYRSSVIQRANDYQGAGDFLAASFNGDLDRLWLVLQELFSGPTGFGRMLKAPFGETVQDLPDAATRASRLLGFDSSGNAIGVVPTAGDASSLALDLASTNAAAKASGQIGFAIALAYAAGTAGSAIKMAADGVNVLHYITPSKWANILAGTSTDDLAAELQTALTAERSLVFPDGLYNTSTKLIPRVDAKLRGINRRGAKLKATAAITLLELPLDNFDCVIENIRFMGTGATYIATATTAGTHHDYAIRPHIKFCDFDYDGAFGINADLIFATIEKNTFGYYGVGTAPTPGNSTFCAIKSFSVTGNFTNLNTIRNNIFQRCGGLTLPAIDISGGSAFLFDSNDFEQGGQVLRAVNIQALQFRGANWMEGNNCTNGLMEIGACNVAPVFDGLTVSGNTCAYLWKYTTGSTKGLAIRYCNLGMDATTYPLFDTTLLVTTLPGDGSVAWHDNFVSGGNALNKVVAGTDFRGGKTSPRVTASIQTSGGIATLLACSDPGATLGYNGVGDSTLTVTQPLGSAANNVAALCTGRTANAPRAVGVTTTTIRVQGFNDAGAAADGIIGLVAYGS